MDDGGANREGRASARIPGRYLRVHVHPHALHLRVLAHRLEAHLAAVAGTADAAERRAGVDALVAVDPDHAGLDGLGDAVGALDVAGPQAGAEAVAGVVGDADGF